LAILIIATAVNLLLALFVYRNDPKSATNRIFGALGLLVSVWLAILYMAEHPDFTSYSLFWTRLSIFIAAPMSAAFFLLAHTIPSNKLLLGKKLFIGMIVSVAIIMALNVSPFAFERLEIVDGAYHPVAGPGIMPFGILSTFFSIGAVYLLFKKYLRGSGREKQQFRFVSGGILLMLGLIIATIFVPAVFFNDASGVALAPLYTLIFLGATAYAIVKHRLLDIRLILARAVSFLLLIVVLAAAYALVLLVGVQRIFGISVDLTIAASAWALTIIAILTFQPLKGGIRKLTQKLFFEREYDSDKLLSQLTRVMTDTIDLEDLVNGVLKMITKEMEISNADLLIVKDHRIMEIEEIEYHVDRSYFPQLEDLFHQYIGEDSHFVFEDLPEGYLKELFRKVKLSVAIPIRVENSEVAILISGNKLSGEPYSQKDIDLLEIFASQAGIAIQNARSYTELKKLSEELEKRVEERTKELKDTQERELAKAKDVARLKDEFVFIAAHELRTPVAAIRGFLELVSNPKRKFPKDVREYLKAISSASGNLSNLINDLLEIARSDAGTLKIETRPVDLMPVIASAVKELSPLAKGSGVRLKFERKSGVSPALADKDKVQEVIVNLLSNAIKYNRKKGSVEVSVKSTKTDLMVEVKDTGYGIPKEDQDKIFQKFFRAKTRETQAVLGTGLGLFISRMLIERMGGRIEFVSKEGTGTTFIFSLPRAE
jgi:signal transduction histidine kinase